MKQSVYIPDDLWERVQRQPDFKLSQFVQQALRERFVGRSRPYAMPDPSMARSTEVVRQHAMGQMKAAYQFGYEMGLDAAAQLSWRAFMDLAETGWDLREWQVDFDDREYEIVDRSLWGKDDAYVDWEGLMEIATDTREDFPRDEHDLPTGLIREGFVDAIRAVWVGTPQDTEAIDASPAASTGDGIVDGVEEASDAEA